MSRYGGWAEPVERMRRPQRQTATVRQTVTRQRNEHDGISLIYAEPPRRVETLTRPRTHRFNVKRAEACPGRNGASARGWLSFRSASDDAFVSTVDRDLRSGRRLEGVVAERDDSTWPFWKVWKAPLEATTTVLLSGRPDRGEGGP
jgi:hypothetical protein